MDVNLTGALVANASIVQPSNTGYLPLLTQVITTLLTIVATLGGIYLAQHLNAKSEAKKRAEEAKANLLIEKTRAYRSFLDVFTIPVEYSSTSGSVISSDLAIINNFSIKYLNAAIDVSEFGDISLLEPGVIDGEKIQSLSDFISAIMKIKHYSFDDCDVRLKVRLMDEIRVFGYNYFCPIILSYLVEE